MIALVLDQLPLVTLIALIGVAFVAGWVDSVVGGGGLIQLPSLLIALPEDTPTPSILATNKISSAAGTLIATITYLSKIKVHWGVVLPLVIGSATGAASGSWLAQFVPKEVFTPVVLVALIAVGLYTWRRPALGMTGRVGERGPSHYLIAGGIGLVIGAYDGVLGPGTGSFFVIALVALLGYGFLEATAKAKIANLTTNLASIAVFGATGYLLVGLGLVMAAANLTGGLIGARMALRYGNGFVRIVFLVVVGALICKLGWDVAWQVIELIGR
ncbi:sulfite exporter TauE/SafE family protein [Naumannella halotolerans]|uniref:Probable membrane transporter protein n=1 Tax=Naumannella halotolerans TaxID=993414 RepID=A0A4R7J6A1_9ACTN|nr:TSUP family transporter [Naumannella halotolerans]TDT32912.1 hypothetical protein CLV29_0503 [Naumannella halotolerans]